MTVGEILVLVLVAALVAAGLFVIATRSRIRPRFVRSESEALLRSSLLNRDRVERINASRATASTQWIDRLRVISSASG